MAYTENGTCMISKIYLLIVLIPTSWSKSTQKCVGFFFTCSVVNQIRTKVPPPNHAEELPTKQIICSPGICDVNVNRPSAA